MRTYALAVIALVGCGGERSSSPVTVAIPPVEKPAIVETSSSVAPRGPRPAGPIAWEQSEPTAVQRAKERHFPLLIFVFADWDAAGRQMDRTVWTDPRVRDRARGFVALRLDLSGEDVNNELYAQRYEVKGLPTTLVIDARGKRVASVVGFAEAEALLEAFDKARE